MVSRIFILCFIVIVGCQSNQASKLPTMKASRDEAVVIGKLLQFEESIPKGIDCGNKHCYAKIQVEKVKETGQDFTKNFEQEKPILAYFTYGADGADSTTHKGLREVFVALKKSDKIIATIKLVGEVNKEKLYQVDLYKNLK
jgi:hypothetical protein